MPLYEYKCSECGYRFELLQTISQSQSTVCPQCGGKVSRVYEGKCAFGNLAGGGSCSGNCKGCSGCGNHR